MVLPQGVELPAGHLKPHLQTTVESLLERLKLAKNHLTKRDRELMDEARDAIFELASGKHEAEVELARERRRRRPSATEILGTPVGGDATHRAHLDVHVPSASAFTQPSVINHDIELDG